MNRLRLRTMVTLTGLLAFFVSMPSLPAQPTRTDAEKDSVLKAMLTELDRSMSQLQLTGFAKPFFVQYRIEDVNDFQTSAEFGSSEGSEHAHQRVVRVTVRVGDYKTDSSGARGDGSLQVTALDDDPIALRSSLWTATDQAYKIALSAYAQKQAELKQVQTPPQADDFSHEKPIVSLADPIALHVDEGSWADRVARASGLYRTGASFSPDQRDIEYSSASFRARTTTTWLVTSEGAIVRKSSVDYQESFAAGTQAPDGMRLDRSYGSSGTSLADLDSEAVFNQHAVDELASLTDLRKSPLVEEEYHGPLLFSADAAADTLRSLLASSVTATRPALGTEARTNGPFASSYRARVMPDFMNVVDDPSLSTFNGKGLLGAYAVDDEGVPAQAVKLVDAGRLDSYLIGRQPVRDFPQSNGHGRAGITGPAHPAIGVLKITADNGLSTGELNQKLLDVAKDRGLSSVYFVQTMGPDRTPRLLYRVSPDGKRELVRGAVLADIDERALRSSIEAAGKDLWVANSFVDPPLTILAPALLFDDATVRRANAKNDKLPFYPPPDLGAFARPSSAQTRDSQPRCISLCELSRTPVTGFRIHLYRHLSRPVAEFNQPTLHPGLTHKVQSERRRLSPMAYELPPLPYDYSALEPFIDIETMKLHHDKHHQTYITNVNNALANHPTLAAKSVDDLIGDLNAVSEDIRGVVRNNGGGHSNHSMFWTIMGPANSTGIGGSPSGDIAKQITADFGDFEAFKKTFNETTAKQFGSGWGWLVFTGGKLKVITTGNQDSPLSQGVYPILGNDVWEHAYYLKYQNRRPDYLAAWWNVVNWAEVNKRFAKAKG